MRNIKEQAPLGQYDGSGVKKKIAPRLQEVTRTEVRMVDKCPRQEQNQTKKDGKLRKTSIAVRGRGRRRKFSGQKVCPATED